MDDPKVLPKVRTDFRKWLEGRIVELKHQTRNHPDVKEAWKKGKPERLEGIFELAGVAANPWSL